MKLPSDGDKVWWQEFDVTPRILEGKKSTIFIKEFYENFSTISVWLACFFLDMMLTATAFCTLQM